MPTSVEKIRYHSFDVQFRYVDFASTLPDTNSSILHEFYTSNKYKPLPKTLGISSITTTTNDSNQGQNTTSHSPNILMGPPIHVVAGDRLKVTLKNSLPNTGLSLHWHGFEMEGSLEYDGVVGITQCPVSPNGVFVYDFTVMETPGTYWYHTHSGPLEFEAYNTVKGPLIVHPPDRTIEDAVFSENKLQYNDERILFFSDGFLVSERIAVLMHQGGLDPPPSKNTDGYAVGTEPWNFGTLNGRLREIIRVAPGKRYKLRLINGGSHFALRISIDGIENMTIVATDSEPVKPSISNEVILHTAERFDIEIEVPSYMKDGETYWIRADTLESRQQGYQHGIRGILLVTDPSKLAMEDVNYDGVSDPSESIWSTYDIYERLSVNCYSKDEAENAINQGGCIPISDLKHFSQVEDDAKMHSNVSYEVHTIDWQFSASPIQAHFVRLDKGLWMQHVNPHTNMLRHDFDYQKHAHAHTSTLHVEANSTVILIWRNKASMDHPFHLHGLKMEILAIDIPTRRERCSLIRCELSDFFDDEKIATLHKATPLGFGVTKDTFILPAGGAVVTRIQTGDPALWFAHCHIENHREDGMAFILNVGGFQSQEHVSWLPSDFPTCDTSFHSSKMTHPACPCYVNKDAVYDTTLTENHRCSRDHLCNYLQSEMANLPAYPYESGISVRSKYTVVPWIIGTTCTSLLIVLSLFFPMILRCYKKKVIHANEIDQKLVKRKDEGNQHVDCNGNVLAKHHFNKRASMVSFDESVAHVVVHTEELDDEIVEKATGCEQYASMEEISFIIKEHDSKGTSRVSFENTVDVTSQDENKTSRKVLPRKSSTKIVVDPHEHKNEITYNIPAPSEDRRASLMASTSSPWFHLERRKKPQTFPNISFTVEGFHVVGEITLLHDSSPIYADHPFWTQVRYLLKKQLIRGMSDVVNILRVIEVVGYGLLVGVLFYNVANNNTMTGIGEQISMLFNINILWTFPRFYPAVVSSASWNKEMDIIFDQKRFSIRASCVARILSILITECFWPFMFCFICLPFVGFFGDFVAAFKIIALLMLNNLCYIMMGNIFGIVTQNAPRGMILAALYGNSSTIAAGFYVMIPSWVEWMRYCCPVYYSFKGILKVVYHWYDSFTCIRGDSFIGPNSCFLELHGFIDDLKQRGINVATFNDPSSGNIHKEILPLVSFYVGTSLFIYYYFVFTHYKIKTDKY